MTVIYKFSIVRWPFLGILSVYCEQSKKYHSNLLTTWNSTFKRPFWDTSNIPHPKQCDSLTKGKSLNEDMRSDLQTWEALAWPEVRAAKKRRVAPMKTLNTMSKLLRAICEESIYLLHVVVQVARQADDKSQLWHQDLLVVGVHLWQEGVAVMSVRLGVS